MRYERAWLTGDLVAGLTVAAYLVPQVMAYATVAGLPAVTGLWAALPALVVYTLLGTSPSLSLGPEATTALMTAIALRPLAAGDAARYYVLAASLALLVGAIAVAAGVLRLGFVADLLSRPVLVGYMAGVALIMIADQLHNVTGVSVTGQTFAAQFSSFARYAAQIQPVTVGLAAGVLLFLFVVGARWPRVPGPLLAVVLATVVVAAAGLEAYGVTTVGPIPAGLPVPRLPDVHASTLRDLALPAVAVVIVAFTDDMLTARSFATRGSMIVAIRELLALGVANAGSSVLQGFPVSSSASRTAIAQAAGRRSQAYSLIVAAAVVLVLAFLHSALTHFPTAALGALVIYAAVRLIDVVAFRRLMAFRRTELAIALAACAAVLLFNILYACSSRSACRSPTCSSASRGRMTRSSAACPAWPACTTSMTTRTLPQSRASWCTAMTRPCSSPTRATSGSERWLPPIHRQARCSGSSSTSRRTSRSTSLRWKQSTTCARRSRAVVPCSPSPGSSRICSAG
jgi:sulfate permease, SulP family